MSSGLFIIYDPQQPVRWPSPSASSSSSPPGKRTRATPYHWWKSPAPWPPKPATDLLSLLEEGALTKGEGYVFSVTVCPVGQNLGLEHLGFLWLSLHPILMQNLPTFGPDSAQIWPRSTLQPAGVQADGLRRLVKDVGVGESEVSYRRFCVCMGGWGCMSVPGNKKRICRVEDWRTQTSSGNRQKTPDA